MLDQLLNDIKHAWRDIKHAWRTMICAGTCYCGQPCGRMAGHQGPCDCYGHNKDE